MQSGIALCRDVTRRQSGVLVSVLVHSAALLALVLAKPNVSPPPAVHVIEVSLVLADPAIPALPAQSPTTSPPAHPIESADAAGARRARPPSDWAAAPSSALGRMPAMSKLYASLYGRLEIDWGIAGALDCLALHKGGDNGASSDPAKQQRCKAKFATITGSTPPARRDKNYDPIEPTALHNIDWVPVLTDWDILLGQMSR